MILLKKIVYKVFFLIINIIIFILNIISTLMVIIGDITMFIAIGCAISLLKDNININNIILIVIIFFSGIFIKYLPSLLNGILIGFKELMEEKI